MKKIAKRIKKFFIGFLVFIKNTYTNASENFTNISNTTIYKAAMDTTGTAYGAVVRIFPAMVSLGQIFAGIIFFLIGLITLLNKKKSWKQKFIFLGIVLVIFIILVLIGELIKRFYVLYN